MMPVGFLQSPITEAREQLAKSSDLELQHAIKTEISELETHKTIEMETWKRYS